MKESSTRLALIWTVVFISKESYISEVVFVAASQF
jgi:hypothetical protein